MTSNTTATSVLANEVKKKVRESGLVLWLDSGAQYGGVIEALARGEHGFTYPVVAHRGSFLETMLALERFGSGLRPEHVLVHLPALNKDGVRETPVLELYEAGTVFEKNLVTLVREAAVGLAKPGDIEAFVREPGLSLEKADAWLASLEDRPRDDAALRFEAMGIEGVVLGLVAVEPRVCASLDKDGAALLAFLEKNLGVTPAFRSFVLGEAALDARSLARLAAAWIMAVEFVSDLREPSVTPELVALAKLGPFAEKCRRLVVAFRDRRPDDYEQFAGELQDLLTVERTSHRADVLGSIDTFRFEEAATRSAALGALVRGEWIAAAAFADERTPEQCFWVKRSQPLQRTWEVIRLAAKAGEALSTTKQALDGCASLDEAVARYVDRLASVDRLHRIFEQRAHALLASDLEEYDALLDVRSAVRRAHRTWADTVNRAFHDLCVKYGALPARSLRQRAVYEEVVHPLVERGERVALILVDALRFEMAQGLKEELEREKWTATLGARLAELPTETKIGMNALAPVEKNGRLRIVMKNGGVTGFASGASSEFTVATPGDRVRAMSARSLGSKIAEDIELESLRDVSPADLKRRLAGKPPLVVVRSLELDKAGEHGLHLGTFDQTLVLLKSALSLLSQAGIEHFVVVSDHGFLLQDSTTENVPFGVSMRVPERRHALLSAPSGKPDVLEIKLSDLEYDVDGDGSSYLVFRPDTALWQTKEKVAPFVHGGNSLQERVIPVLVLERRGTRGKTISKYEVVAHAEPARVGRQRLRVAVRLQNRETGSLGFVAPKLVSLALRVPGATGVTLQVHDAGPPAKLVDGRILVPPNRDEAIVEFELEGEEAGKARVEVFHPDAVEDVTPKLVEGFFDVGRNRRAPRPSDSPAAPQASAARLPPATIEFVADEHHRKVLQIIAERRMINEVDLGVVLGSPMRVRIFARQIDALRKLVPFEIEIVTVNGMKVYARKD